MFWKVSFVWSPFWFRFSMIAVIAVWNPRKMPEFGSGMILF